MLHCLLCAFLSTSLFVLNAIFSKISLLNVLVIKGAWLALTYFFLVDFLVSQELYSQSPWTN